MARGTGIRFRAGTPTQYDGGGAQFNPDADPFDAAGLLLIKDRNSQVWADRYCGGRLEDVYKASPWQSEFMMWIGQGLARAAKRELELPAGAYIEPGDWDNDPTLRERADAEYMVSEQWMAEVWKAIIPVEPGDGKTPQTAMSVTRPDNRYKYFTEPNARFSSITMYFKNTAPGASGVDPKARWPKDQIPSDTGQKAPTDDGPIGMSEQGKLDQIKKAADDLRAKLPKGGGAPMRMLVGEVTKFLDRVKGA